MQNKFDNVNGTVDLSLDRSIIGQLVSGFFIMGTILFKARAATGSTDISFNSKMPRLTDISFQGESLLRKATGLELKIQ